MVNTLATKDSRWLQLEVCREYQRSKCTRPDTECKFAHPPASVEIQSGRVVACYDSIKGRCNREKPPCKYFHPPQHLKDQLLINGRNHLALKNALLHQMPLQTVLTGQLPMATISPYFTNLPLSTGAYGTAYSHAGHHILPISDQLTNYASVVPNHQAAATAAAMAAAATVNVPQQRNDRLEVCREFQRGNCKRPEGECRFAHPPAHVQSDPNEGLITVCMDFIKGRCSRAQCRYFHPPMHLQTQLKQQANQSQQQPRVQPSHPVPHSAVTAGRSFPEPYFLCVAHQK